MEKNHAKTCDITKSNINIASLLNLKFFTFFTKSSRNRARRVVTDAYTNNIFGISNISDVSADRIRGVKKNMEALKYKMIFLSIHIFTN